MNDIPAVRRVPPSQLGEAGEQGACYRNRQLFVLFAKPRGLRAVFYKLSFVHPNSFYYVCGHQIQIFHYQLSILNSMADNYLERQRDAYEARKAAWEKKKKHAAALKKAAARTTGDGAEMLHPFASPTEGIELPRQFT